MSLSMKICAENVPRAIIEKVSYAFAKKNLILPLEEKGGVVFAAIADPLNVNALDELSLMLDKKVKGVVIEEAKILSLINECYNHEVGATSKLLANLAENGKRDHRFRDEEEEEYDLLAIKEEAPLVRLLNLILSEAIHQRASDIHFEPFESDLKIRYRIDGMLQERHAPDQQYQAQLLSRIKVLAKLDIAEHRLPQDGRMKLKMGGKQIDFRVSTIPVASGERIVLRILDKGNLSSRLDDLGMLPTTLDSFKELLSLPEGIVLVTGPTGSGKTTTLYSGLSEIKSSELNIMTIEDPIEYKFTDIAQIAVRPKIGLTFATGLRHILRQDPDVIMVGEIRDTETAEIAIQAALTGHLVLSTLHTNDAPSAITRLVDMGVEPYLISSTVAGVLAQRLVRKICPHCREGYVASPKEITEIYGITDKSPTLYRGKGCEMCFGTGYLGRHGIYELLPIGEKIQSEIAKNPDAAFLRRLALEQGMTTLQKHGAHLVKSGITTVSEVMRVTRKGG